MSGSEKHAGVGLYWVFCVILCVITACEWAIFKFKEAWSVSNTMLVATLIICSLVKFVMVVGWYMHLRYDIRMLKNIFIFSLIGASLVFTGLVFAL